MTFQNNCSHTFSEPGLRATASTTWEARTEVSIHGIAACKGPGPAPVPTTAWSHGWGATAEQGDGGGVNNHCGGQPSPAAGTGEGERKTCRYDSSDLNFVFVFKEIMRIVVMCHLLETVNM